MGLRSKAEGIFKSVVLEYPDTFDKEMFSVDNLFWALVTVESRILFINYQAFILPMIESVTFEESKVDKKRNFTPEVLTDGSINFFSMDKVAPQEVVVENINFPNDKLLMSYGQVVRNHSNDCFTVSVAFSMNTDDALHEVRRDFFSKYFLYDQNHHDIV